MDEGCFRVLRALGDGAPLARTAVVNTSGEPPSVIRSAIGDHPEWFHTDDPDRLRATTVGLAALAREIVGRLVWGEGSPEGLDDQASQALARYGRRRGRVKRDLDQVWATPNTTLRRARLLIERGEVQRGLAFLGDDDMTSLAIHLLGKSRKTTVFDIDEDLLRLYQSAADSEGWEHRGVRHDLRGPFDKRLRGRFGCVFTDPPYASEGFALFISRAIELLRPDGRLWVCMGYSRRARERGLQKQRMLADAGLLVEEVIPHFNRYEGAQSIGASSSLYIAAVTPTTKPLVRGQVDGDLYTRR